MSKKTYELCFDVEGLRIIPIGENQVSVQILSEESDSNILTDEGEVGGILEQHQSQPLFLAQSQSILEDRDDERVNLNPASRGQTQSTSTSRSQSLASAVGSHIPRASQKESSLRLRDVSEQSIHQDTSPVGTSVQRKQPVKLLSTPSQQVLPAPILPTAHPSSQISQNQVGKLPQQLFSNDGPNSKQQTSSSSLIRLTSSEEEHYAVVRNAAEHHSFSVHNAATQNISRQINQPLPTTVKKEIVPSINLYIEYGRSWVNDLLEGMSVDWMTTSDFPVYCCDGIAWSNRVIIGSLNVQLRNLLLEADEDSCIVLPQIKKEEFDTFMEFILKKETVFTKEIVSILLKVGEVFDFPIRYISLASSNCKISSSPTIDYSSIFTNQKEEFIQRISKQYDLAELISKSTKRTGFSEQCNQLSSGLSNIQEIDPFNIFRHEQQDIEGLECDECPRILPSEQALQDHINIVHSNIKQLKKHYSCPKCSKKFSFRSNVLKHQILVHSNSNSRQKNHSFLRNTDIILSGHSPDRLSPVLIKQKVCKEYKALPSVVCKICGITCKNRRALVAHNQKHYGRLHQCPVDGCGKRFTESSKLRRHMVVHTKEKNFECPLCKKRFTLLQNVKSHVKNHHKISKAEQISVINKIMQDPKHQLALNKIRHKDEIASNQW